MKTDFFFFFFFQPKAVPEVNGQTFIMKGVQQVRK